MAHPSYAPWRIGPVGAVIALIMAAASCSQKEPPKRYDLKGQVLGVRADRQELTIRHEDIPGFMPAMTMTYPVTPASLLDGRTPGEIITATLEVDDAQGRLVAIAHAGTAPLPENVNELAMAAGLLEEGDTVPDAAFIDQQDRRRSFAEWQGTLTLVTFIYTSCPLPNFCPLMDQNFATLQGAIREDPALRGRVKLVSISFDPAHDTPAVLAAHAARRKADPEVWTFLTGDQKTIDRFSGQFGVGIMRPETPGEIVHNLRTALIDRQGHVVKIYSGSEWTPGTVLADLRAALARS
jgi:protein SCO1/2